MSDLERISEVIKRAQKKFKLTPPAPFVPTEYDEQCAIFDYAKVAAKQDPRWKLLFSTLNGVRLPIGLAKKCKKAGNNPGVPDIILPIPLRPQALSNLFTCPGLYIELKRQQGSRVAEEQEWWHEQLRREGYRVEVCRGAKEAIAVIEDYLKGGVDAR